ncbi:AbrB/MazE/SpoVT family DNA-binding domain-containing protein [Lactobacillus sp. PV037]|uniref:AbrB/MazE/SpoVT family DNA-binding domain-containing protein n=1 Tax=unclassified Lactobacillus TaxID=2620435 RepID=UPI00223FB754|nr:MULTISPECIES: AbrB/MazE/SpoVT family DNA-binding domain-containing protein [unclassified Lactobacillus]QNQ82268.1 AbrB/MazE/SpoVT family DNA-binding domain-containing protein [Lactobacillus sp. PV012]QNQ83621.1 AbrB/MazE/SpoVT family DNA-binding domain-containing protein [Lactobacillus sp. PV037]
MENQLIRKMSQKGQIVIPVSIRKALGLEKGTKLSFKLNGDEITIKKAPSVLEWAEVLKEGRDNERL